MPFIYPIVTDNNTFVGFPRFHNATTKNDFTRTYHALCGQTLQWLDWFWRHNWSDFVLHWTDLHYFRTFGHNTLTSKCPARANQTRARHLSLTAGGTSAEIRLFLLLSPCRNRATKKGSRSQPRRRKEKVGSLLRTAPPVRTLSFVTLGDFRPG